MAFFEELQQHLDLEMPMVVYRKPGRTVLSALLQQDQCLYSAPELDESGFIFSRFEPAEGHILIPEKHAVRKSRDYHQPSFSSPVSSGSEDPQTTHRARQNHLRLVKKALKAIDSGVLEKVVVSRQEEIPLKNQQPLILFQDLLRRYPEAMVYLWYHPVTGTWLGATPESLLEISGNRFSTMALAGTQVFQEGAPNSWGEKESMEQQMVTDEILEAIRPFIRGIQLSDVESVKAGNLLHLRTSITGKHSQGSLRDLIQSLHPTPAVCGLPRQKAMEFILNNEGYDRQYYTGFLGEINLRQSVSRSRNTRNVEEMAYRRVRKETDLYVNLRCMKMDTGKATLFIGGGITDKSDPRSEWEETIRKAETMKAVLSS